jgi:hypothetical protein
VAIAAVSWSFSLSGACDYPVFAAQHQLYRLVSRQQMMFASSLHREDDLHHNSEMQGSLLPRVSWKVQVSISAVLAVAKHHQHHWLF